MTADELRTIITRADRVGAHVHARLGPRLLISRLTLPRTHNSVLFPGRTRRDSKDGKWEHSCCTPQEIQEVIVA